MKIGVEIITGFLASGKTTLINALLRKTDLENENILVLQLESGNKAVESTKSNIRIVRIDDEIKDSHELIYLAIKTYKPRRIIIEYNGSESLMDFYNMVETTNLSNLIKINCIYFVSEAKTFLPYLINMEEIIMPYVESSNLIIINNCYDTSSDKLIIIKNKLEEINLFAHILFVDKNKNIGEEVNKYRYIGKDLFRNIYNTVTNMLNGRR